MTGTDLTHWTIRIALVCLAARIAGDLLWGSRREWSAWSRIIWSLGCIFFIGHVVCAFQFFHHWSHEHALEVTAQRTQEMMGISFGEGIYFSYVFALLWLGDAIWQWVSPTTYQQRTLKLTLSLFFFMTFIAFNGAVIFESGVTRWWGIPVSLALLVLAIRSLQQPRTAPHYEAQATP